MTRTYVSVSGTNVTKIPKVVRGSAGETLPVWVVPLGSQRSLGASPRAAPAGSCTCRQRIMPAGVNRVNSSPFTVVKGDAIMTPNVVFEQLLVVALVLICLLMHVWGPSARSPASQRPCKPAQPRRTRAKDPKPFTGYIPKPLWEACEQRLDARLKAPGAPPPMLIFTRGRRRTVD